MSPGGLVPAIETRYCRTEPVAKKPVDQSDMSLGATRRVGRRALRYLVVLVCAVVLVDALAGDKGLLAMLKARREYRALEQALAQAKDENVRLRDEARRLRDDPTAVEDLARRDLGLIRPGEKLFVIRDIQTDPK